MRQISMKPQDVVVAIKIAILGENKRTFSSLANDLALSASEVHAAQRDANKREWLQVATVMA